MKLVLALTLAFVATAAHAASLREIFESIAKATSEGNGNGHYVTTWTGQFNEAREIAKMEKRVNATENDCRYEVHADIEGAISEIETQWEENKTAARLRGLHKKHLIQQIVYSVWDPTTGDSEYCSISQMNVYGIDGSLLQFDFNETD